MRLIGYVRVSRVAGREGESFISPDVERERIDKYAQAQDHRVAAWQEDLDQPGSRYERPGFQLALEAVERGEAEGIAVVALDRFARSVPDAAIALKRLEAAGGTLIAFAMRRTRPRRWVGSRGR
jgi:DNA invertase Pin-like site-specific DNA recombinase